MLNFTSFGLPSSIVQSLEQLNIVQPTAIQEQAIPAALAGTDILATAQTGTGKTLAYLLPLISKMQDSAYSQAVILAPTRELAEQIKNALGQLLGRKGQHEAVLLIGGAPIYKQMTALKKRPAFIIGTPGRMIDHLQRGSLILKNVQYLILDEMDRMLDMGFSEDLEKIIQHIPKERQTLMFSATLPPNIAKLSQKYLREPKHITIGSTTQPAVQIKQDTIKTTGTEKFTYLLKELDARDGSVIIFVKTKIGADQLAERLHKREFQVDAIHGDLKQRQREAVIRAFRDGKYRILVATDIAARGLDIPHIKHVINYDLPQCAEDYIHRIGRTGRAGMTGSALSFILPQDSGLWRRIQQLLNPNEKQHVPMHTRNAKSGGRHDRKPKSGATHARKPKFAANKSQKEQRFQRKKQFQRDK